MTVVDLPSDPRPVLSVVVVTHGQKELVRRCLRSVASAATLPTEVVVVDNASADGTAELVRSCPGVVMASNRRNEGFGAGANRGVVLARGPYVALLNSDAVVVDGWDTGLVGVLRRQPRLAAVVPRYLAADGSVWESGVVVDGRADARQVGAGSRPEEAIGAGRRLVGHGSAAAMVVRRSTFVLSGGFDPSFGLGYYEDADLVRRWARHGLGIAVEPSVVVTHARGASSSEDTKLALLDRNRVRFARRWGASLGSTPGGSEWDAHPGRRTQILSWWSDAQVRIDARSVDVAGTADAVARLPYDLHVVVDAPSGVTAPPGTGLTEGSVTEGSVMEAGVMEAGVTAQGLDAGNEPLIPEVVVSGRMQPSRASGRMVVAPAGRPSNTARAVESALRTLGVAPQPPIGPMPR